MSGKLTICIDRGGTFTDCIGFLGKPGAPGTKEFVVKLLSEDPANYKDAPTEGIRRIVELASGRKIPRNEPVPTDMIGKLTRYKLERGVRFMLLIDCITTLIK